MTPLCHEWWDLSLARVDATGRTMVYDRARRLARTNGSVLRRVSVQRRVSSESHLLSGRQHRLSGRRPRLSERRPPHPAPSQGPRRRKNGPRQRAPVTPNRWSWKTNHHFCARRLAQLPRRCPICDRDTIVSHGRRRKQSHDEGRDWIWIRRGRCKLCKKSFTVLPAWSPPSGHYSYDCRRQADDAAADGNLTPNCRDAHRLPDDSTLRRWAWRRLISLWIWTATLLPAVAPSFLGTPTILAWDFPAAGRILRLEANSP